MVLPAKRANAAALSEEVYSPRRALLPRRGRTASGAHHGANTLSPTLSLCEGYNLDLADYAYVLETGGVVMADKADVVKNDETIRKSYLGY